MKTKIHLGFSLLLLISLIACQKNEEINSVPICPESQDLGLLELDQESINAIPYDYELNEKLIFKNANNEEIVLYPQHPSTLRYEQTESRNVICDGQVAGTIDFSYIDQLISYRSSNNYIFSFRLNIQPFNDRNVSNNDFLFYDLLTIKAFRIDYKSIIFEDNCLLKIAPSFRGNEPFETGPIHITIDPVNNINLGNDTFDEVYIADGTGEMNLKYTKQHGLISFTDIQGVEYLFDRKEAYNVNIAPNLSLPDISGTPINLHDIDAELILVDFWASWCEACRIEIEETLKPLYDTYKDQGLEIYSISIDEDAEEWINAIEEDQTNWIHVNDLMGYNSEVFQRYEIYGIPTVYILDQQKNILSSGGLHGEELTSFVASYFD